MASRPDLYSAATGFSIIGGSALLSSTGPPGGDGDVQDAAPLGSLFLRKDTGTVYTKLTLTNSPLDWEILVSSDIITYSAQNAEGVSLPIGTPVILSSGQFFYANATFSTKIRVVGLTLDTSLASGATGLAQTAGVFSATTAQWDAITGGSGGLTPGPYYLSTTSGMLTNIPPSATGQYIVEVGLALSQTKMRIQVQAPLGL
jgi:hypothetical protein